MSALMRPRLLPSSIRHVIARPGVQRYATYLTLYSKCFSSAKRFINIKSLTQSAHKEHLPLTLRRYYSTSEQPFILQDPLRPAIFYHLIDAPNPLSRDLPAYAVSLLETPPAEPRSPAVMGWLLAASTQNNQEAGIQDFLENGSASLSFFI